MDYFIADTHFSDENIIKYYHRPFTNAEGMDHTMIDNWNNKITDDDTVYLLGDVGNYKILDILLGHITVICGNHDSYDEMKNYLISNENVEVINYEIVKDYCILSHEPLVYLPVDSPYLNIHGHTHIYRYGLDKRLWKEGNRYFCVSAEQVNYTPISKEEIANCIMKSEVQFYERIRKRKCRWI